MERDQEGHRTYTLHNQVTCTSTNDGPWTAFFAPGLPITGSPWAYGNDSDPFARCWPNARVNPFLDKERQLHWNIENTFSTRPFKRCQDEQVENPLAEPMRIGGSFIKFTKIGTRDRFGRRMQNPAFEPFKEEFDDNRPTVSIGMNLATLPLGAFAALIDYLNDGPLWGLPARTVKLCNVRWTRAVYGVCSYYYVVDYEFEINYQTWDRYIQNDATKRLKTGGSAADPRDFELATDGKGNPIPTILNANGTLWDGGSADTPPATFVQYYPQANLLTLGIPSSLA